MGEPGKLKHEGFSGLSWISPGALTQLVIALCSGGAMAYAAYVLTAPGIGPPPLFPFQDKVFHAACFAVLTGPGVLVLPQRYLWFWVGHVVFLGVGIELVQWKYIPTRTGSIDDFLADAAGIAAAVFVARTIRGAVLGREQPRAGDVPPAV